MVKTSWKLLLVLFGVCIIFIIAFWNFLFQEESPFLMASSVIELETTDSDYIQISDEPKKYLLYSDTKGKPIFAKYGQEGWEYHEQIGSGHLFTKGDKQLRITERMWTERYLVMIIEE